MSSPELPAGAKAEVIILLETPVTEESTEPKQRVVSEKRSTTQCVLCGKSREAVKKLILGVYGGVCVDCVDLCQEIIEKPDSKARELKRRRRDVVLNSDYADFQDYTDFSLSRAYCFVICLQAGIEKSAKSF